MNLKWKSLAYAALFTACSLVPLSAHAQELPVRQRIVQLAPSRSGVTGVSGSGTITGVSGTAGVTSVTGVNGISLARPNPALESTLATVRPSIEVSFTTNQTLISGQHFADNEQLELVVTVNPNGLSGGTLLDTNVETAGTAGCLTSRACTNQAPGTFLLSLDTSALLAPLQCGDDVGITVSDVNHNLLASTGFTNCLPV